MKTASPAARLIGGAFFAFGVIAYVTLFRLQASPAGHGTHTALGLPACSYLATKHYPCPGCGVTTSMTEMSHGKVFAALSSSVFGTFAFLAVLFLAVAGLLQAVTGRDFLSMFKPRPGIVLLIIVLFFASWGLKTGLGVLDGRYPIR